LSEADPSSVTRRHFIRDHAPALAGCISIVGGKLTTYRSLSEQTVDVIFKKLERSSPPCQTAQVKLPGAMSEEEFAAFSQRFKTESGLTEASAARLLGTYGTRASEVV